METQPEAADVRRALDEIAVVRTRAAARKRTPWWMWHVLGMLSLGWVCSYALPGAWGTWANWIFFGCFIVAGAVIARRTGVGPFEGTRLGRWGAVLIVLPALLLAIAAAIAYVNGVGAWVLVLAGIVQYLCFVVGGPISERHFGAPTQALS